jgi:alkanesulfonate monooxygenase SsuD/methylene tetrahydromethanopterin reductase-like flavin-dependent oxidoreductase (luciferase family)
MLALTGKPFSYDGKYYRIPETTVFPKPVQKPGRRRAGAVEHAGDAEPAQQRRAVESGRALPVPFANEPSTDDLLEKFSMTGTPDTCIRQIRRLPEVMHIDHFN